MIEAHRYLAENILAAEELRAEIEEYEWTTTPYMTKTGENLEGSTEVHEGRSSRGPRRGRAPDDNRTPPQQVQDGRILALGVSRKTVVKAFGGVTKLGWLEEFPPQPNRHFDDPVIYRFLPAESRLAAESVQRIWTHP